MSGRTCLLGYQFAKEARILHSALAILREIMATARTGRYNGKCQVKAGVTV
jgi:hypothetical protein